MKAVFQKRGNCLVPMTDSGEEMVSRLPNEPVEVEVRISRHGATLGWLFVVLEKAKENSEYPTVETLLTEAKLAVGHYKVLLDGFVGTERFQVREPDSISYEAMDELDFRRFVDRVMDWVVAQWGQELVEELFLPLAQSQVGNDGH